MRVLIALLLVTTLARADDVPLLVVLHGDGERAETAAKRWRAATTKRGWKLLALQCPRAQRCKDSWWKWNGDPQWVRDQIAAVKGVDAQRIYAAGWSGGATYLGMRAPAWDVFAAVVIHGGGMAPTEDTCPARALPAYFLVGDKNPLHHLAVGLREYFARCAGAVEWDLVSGAGHLKEHRALDTKKALAILDWLSAHTRK